MLVYYQVQLLYLNQFNIHLPKHIFQSRKGMIRLFTPARKMESHIRYYLRYTRQYFQDLNIDHEQIQKNKIVQAQNIKKQQILSVVSNDKNPNNFIKNLKINHQALGYPTQYRQKFRVKQCAILTPEPPKPKILFEVNRRYIISTLKKATLAMKPIRKCYLLDAINKLKMSHKKVSKVMIPTLFNAVTHAINKGLNPFCLYIHGVLVGRRLKFRGLRYHAKGKGGRENKTVIQIKVLIQQKDEDQFFEQVAVGQAPPGFASLIRNRLIELNAGYEKLVQLSGITTAKGRQQKRQIIKRKIKMIMNQNDKNKRYVPKKTIQKQLRKEEGQKIKQIILGLKPEGYIPKIKSRQKEYKKNMGIE